MQKIDRQVAFTGTKDVAEPLRFDPARLEAYLAREVKGFAGPLTVSQFKGGQSNPTYRLTTPDRTYVLRRKPSGALLASAHAVDREYRVMEALGAAGVEVAQQVLAETQSAVLPLVPYLDTLRWVFIAVALGGIAVTIYARLDDWKRGRR